MSRNHVDFKFLRTSRTLNFTLHFISKTGLWFCGNDLLYIRLSQCMQILLRLSMFNWYFKSSAPTSAILRSVMRLFLCPFTALWTHFLLLSAHCG